MTYILESFIIFFMLCGVICTFAPKMRGTIIILIAIMLYGMATSFKSMETWMLILLFTVSGIVEIGSSVLRIYLTKQEPISRNFAINAAMSKCAGIIAANAVFGSSHGILLWELIASRVIMPYLHVVSKILLRMSLIALCRIVVGISMVAFALVYIIE